MSYVKEVAILVLVEYLLQFKYTEIVELEINSRNPCFSRIPLAMV